MKLSQAAKVMDAALVGEDRGFNGISIDSRTIKNGELFFALKGANFDGHHFVNQAAQKGAAAVVVSALIESKIPSIKVNDVHKALIQLASAHRLTMPVKIIAITGSCGKTTTRSLMENIFAEHGKTLASEKSYNNNIGVPLTLLRITPDCQYAVCEMGANHAGELSELTQMAKPDVAIINNAAAAHLEGFGDLDGVARAKAEIYQGLSASGVAIINADDHYADYWRKLIGNKNIISFGIHKPADITAKNIQFNQHAQPVFDLYTPAGNIKINLQLMGGHNVMNALSATAAAIAQNVPLKTIKAGLEKSLAVVKRLAEKKGFAGATIIDDSYNANPFSVRAAMEVLIKKNGYKILVLGDMGELGEKTQQYHEEIGKEAADKGIHKLFAYGQLSKNTVQAFGKNAYHFQDQMELVRALKNELSNDVTVLVKGSRSMRMENVVEALIES